MSWLKKLNCFLIVLSALSFSGEDAYAQNVFKLDFLKSPAKFGDTVQKQGDGYEKNVKGIGESQFATFIGKGVKAAKKGIKYAKGKIKEAKDFYKQVKSTVNAVKQSTEYKIAMLSKQEASEILVLNNLKKQRDTEKALKKSDFEIQRVATEEKLKIAKENFNVGIKILEDEITKLKTEEEKDFKRKEIAAYRTANQDAIAGLEDELGGAEETYKEESKAIDIDFAAKILEQSTIIANIGIEIAELIKEKKREKGEAEKDPEEVINETVTDFSYKEGEVVTLETRRKKAKTRKRKVEATAISASGYSTGIIAKTEEKKEEEQQNSAVSGTLNGKSEALETAISQTVVQLDSLYEYLLLELKSIELETANTMSSNSDYKVGEVKASINICDYEIDKESFLEKIKKAKDNVQGAVNQTKDTVNKAKDAINQTKDAVATTKDAVNQIKEVVNDVSANPEGMVSGLTGM